jgi:hypothetical protein
MVTVSGRPPESMSYTHYTSYINEYIWSSDTDEGKQLNNCYISQDLGMLRASREIEKGDELTLYLGPEYDWDTYKYFLIVNCIQTIGDILTNLVTVEVEEWCMQCIVLENSLRGMGVNKNLVVKTIRKMSRDNSKITLNRILELVEGIGIPDEYCYKSPERKSSLLDYVNGLYSCKAVQDEIIFRRAFKPGRPKTKWSTETLKPLSTMRALTTRVSRYAGLRNRPLNTGQYEGNNDINTSLELEKEEWTLVGSKKGRKPSKILPAQMCNHITGEGEKNSSSSSSSNKRSRASMAMEIMGKTSTSNGGGNSGSSSNDGRNNSSSNSSSSSRNGIRNCEDLMMLDQVAKPLAPANEDLAEGSDPTQEPSVPMSTRPITAIPQMKVVFVNINGLNATKLEVILSRMEREKIDVLTIADIRINNDSAKALARTVQTRLGPGSQALYSTCTNDMVKVGGQMVIIGPQHGKTMHSFWTERSGLGLVVSITLQLGKTSLMIMGTYWPCSPTGKRESKGVTLALYSKAESYLQKNKNRLNPIEYIRDVIEQKMQKHLAGDNTAFILGETLMGEK